MGARGIILRAVGFLLFAVWLACWRYYWRTLSDDALITIRYAMNLASGQGFVFNPGEKVLGTSTPLFALILAAVEWMRIPAWIFAQVLDVAAVLATSAVVVYLGRRVGHEPWAWLAVAFFALDPLMALSVAGMETGFFTCLVYAACIAAGLRRPRLAVLLTIPAVMTRMEGYLLIPVVLGFSVLQPAYRNRESFARLAILLLFPTLFYATALNLYFGSPLPHSMMAKMEQTSSNSKNYIEDPMVWDFFRSLFVYYGKESIAWGVFECVAFIATAATFPQLRPLLLWCTFYLLFMFAGKAPSQYWYHQPLYLARWMCAAWLGYLLVGVLLTGLQSRRWISRPELLRAAGASLLLVLMMGERLQTSLTATLTVRYLNLDAWEAAHYADAARYIRQKASEEDEIAAPEIGYLGVVSGSRIFDVIGLVSPAALSPAYRELDPFASVAQRGSRFMVSRFPVGVFTPLNSSFLRSYRIDRSWWARDGKLTIVFEKRESPLTCFDCMFIPAGVFPKMSLRNFTGKTYLLHDQRYGTYLKEAPCCGGEVEVRPVTRERKPISEAPSVGVEDQMTSASLEGGVLKIPAVEAPAEKPLELFWMSPNPERWFIFDEKGDS